MPPAKKKTTPKVDTPVENQENPVTSTEERESTNTEPREPEVPKMAPANKVDETVVNQENPGSGEMVDRLPEPVILEDSNGIKFDVSKPFPELITDDPETEMRRAEIRQSEGVLNAKDIEGPEDEEEVERPDTFDLYFLESGLTANGRVWKAGQTLKIEDTEDGRRPHEDSEGNVWYELSASEQKERYGKVFFEKR